ncbi:fimbrial protein [Salmonella enterica]|uniref:Fimbrial protein n=1 Tax=Salmonella enterica TaxID=28901 RepID=A0A5T4LPU3_SALER|nr:fimbrial protein [Salmonella enterica]
MQGEIRMKRISGLNEHAYRTLLLLAISLFPAGVIAGWSAPGEDFSGELVVGGQVTDIRNPWRWKMAGAESEMNLSASVQNRRGAGHVWTGLLDGRSLLLGKTEGVVMTGRDGLAPEVTFGSGSEGFELSWQGSGEAEVMLPVYDSLSPAGPVGQFTFRLVAAAMLSYVSHEQTVYRALYNDGTGNGLPARAMAVPAESTGELLCSMFAGEGPEWLCRTGRLVTGSEPLSRLADTGITRPEGVFGVRMVSGSGVLRTDGDSPPPRWKATLPVRIEYR